jgi:hypothetical protein
MTTDRREPSGRSLGAAWIVSAASVDDAEVVLAPAVLASGAASVYRPGDVTSRVGPLDD